jgi:Na+/alanine symporter
MIYVGAVIPLNVVWQTADLINAMMVIPSVTALYLLHRKLSY